MTPAPMTDVGAEAVALLTDLVGIDSVNPGLVPGAAGERAIVAYLSSRLAPAGFETTVITPPEHPDRPSLVAVPRGPHTGATLVLNGHLDTVGVSGMPAPFEATVVDDRLYARGAADMKGGIAAIVAAAEAAVAVRSPVRPVLVLVADEEDTNLGSEAAVAVLPDLGVSADACLIAEPTDLALCRSLRGFAVIRVSFPGRAAHSSQPEQGVNAITHLGRLLYAVDQGAPAVREAGGDLMVTVAAGGSSAFVVPEHAECLVEVRTRPDQSAADALAQVRAMLDPRWRAIAELVAHRDGWQLADTGPAAELATALGASLGTGRTFEAPYWMEAPLWEAVAPTAVCGPSGGGLHAVDEWVELSQVRAHARAVLEVLMTWTPDGD